MSQKVDTLSLLVINKEIKADMILIWMQITVVIVRFSVLYSDITSGKLFFLNFVLQKKTDYILGTVIIGS
jgi:hypothetical protein